VDIDHRGAVVAEIDGRRLLRLVVLRRRLQVVALIAVTTAVLLHAISSEEPGVWVAVAAMLSLAAALVVAVACTWGRSPERRLATACSPLPRAPAAAGPRPDSSSTDPRAQALVEVLSRRCLVNPLAVLAVIAALFGFSFVVMVPSATAASFGHGYTVTVGVDAHIDHVERGKSPVYYLATPRGVVLAEEDRPARGEQWVLTGGRHPVAYRRGGPDFVVLILLAVAGLATAAACAVATVRRWRREWPRRRSHGSTRALHTAALGFLHGGPVEVTIGGLAYRVTGGRPTAARHLRAS
jgi:hypothetical protein